jgi:hypothetical protein
MATYTKGQKGGISFLAAKWTWTDEDKPKGVKGWFGFTNLNPRFCHCHQDAMMMNVNLALPPF